MTRLKSSIFAATIFIVVFSCTSTEEKEASSPSYEAVSDMSSKVKEYKSVKLSANLSHLSDNQKEMIRLLIDASDIMDDLFWRQTYGDKNELLSNIGDDAAKRYAEINYGPWDRLDGDKPFIKGFGEKPKGANFYPKGMTEEEFIASTDQNKAGLYTILKYDENGELYAVPYHEEYKNELTEASQLLRKASSLAEDEGFRNYLELRSKALLNSKYRESDMAWMDMKNNDVDLVIGPIENYEDQLFNYKTAFEAYVLIKDKDWSEKLEKYVAFLPELQKSLPVADEYKQEQPGTDSDLNAYDVVYYAGNCNSGGKTIAINLPNDEEVQLNKGTRRLQLKNAMRAKFDEIMLPIAKLLIDTAQINHVTFDAFFANTMFHEVAHGLGIKNTINDKGTVRKALKEKASAIEEGKADILGVYMVTELFDKGELDDSELMDYYVTFMAGIFRSIRFGSSSAHGMANMIRFNYFKEMNAFEYDSANGRYSVNFDNFQKAIASLSNDILVVQGNGDYEGASMMFEKYGLVGEGLQADLNRINEAGIPRDIVFEQGKEVLGL